MGRQGTWSDSKAPLEDPERCSEREGGPKNNGSQTLVRTHATIIKRRGGSRIARTTHTRTRSHALPYTRCTANTLHRTALHRPVCRPTFVIAWYR